MKRVMYTQPRTGDRGSIRPGHKEVVSDSTAQKLVDRGQAEIVEDIPDAAPPKAVETAKAPEHDAAERADARPVKARYGGKPAE